MNIENLNKIAVIADGNPGVSQRIISIFERLGFFNGMHFNGNASAGSHYWVNRECDSRIHCEGSHINFKEVRPNMPIFSFHEFEKLFNEDLTKLLRGHEGIELYSPAIGRCTFKGISSMLGDEYPIEIIDQSTGKIIGFTKDGKLRDRGEVLLFPSKENRDWLTFNPKKKLKAKQWYFINHSDEVWLLIQSEYIDDIKATGYIVPVDKFNVKNPTSNKKAEFLAKNYSK